MFRVAVALITVQLAIRAVLAFGGYYYWDDLVLVGRAGTQNLLSPGYLFDDHDGHVMPGAFLVSGIITLLAPLNWIGPAVSLVVLQLLASLSLLRVLHVILGWRPVLLIPLTFGLFCPLALPSFAWWAAALNALPLAAAMAWVTADAILLVRTGERRYAVSAIAVFVGALLFFEKSAVIPFVAFTVVALLLHVTGETPAVRTAWQRATRLWMALGAATVVWIGVYLLVVDQKRWTFDFAMTKDLLWRSVTHGIVPGLVGGPWTWDRWEPASPWTTPSLTVKVLGWAALAAVVLLSFRRKRRIGPVWAAAVGYVVACQVPIYLMRSSQFTALELAQTLRYLGDLVVVLSMLAAVGLCAPNRPDSGRLDASRGRAVAVTTACALFVASSVYTAVDFRRVWRDNPTRDYLVTAEHALAQAKSESDAPLLDQDIDPIVLTRFQWPENLASHVFALLDDRPSFETSTTRLRMFDQYGHLIDAKVTWVRSIVPGPEPNCGYLIQPDTPVRVPLNGPLLPSDWTAEINYLANSDGSLTISLTDGEETKVPVRPGLNRVFVRLRGAGDAIVVRANTSALSVCLAAGPVGHIAPL